MNLSRRAFFTLLGGAATAGITAMWPKTPKMPTPATQILAEMDQEAWNDDWSCLTDNQRWVFYDETQPNPTTWTNPKIRWSKDTNPIVWTGFDAK